MSQSKGVWGVYLPRYCFSRLNGLSWILCAKSPPEELKIGSSMIGLV